ncbi:rhodanese-like domain-containing protein [Paenarthrobacter aurescens]|uniref:Sulfurtransferase n=1 Tax=Paenarthrobacter aurescens TaxID=43663 RepID=A0A4Y3NDW5_PAEAU|nr:rhodanese-like domain-containing protein [Paenarthrobacter aurescens]MDO6145076.1 rhodanese-like domain-containing protein [Paenarthrobacter aurescens]MDO6148921.1 rhodanese-like domain-containing protein [Paenarthrobacter aurescens]MDO6160167.1 rhodanese-like domain-containing protein [Paenarthrobacter aurescens]MDO6164026.1 rhodanese-like domain-containing protein [Paenarthrobacter aurescens]GEB17258.1 sulfurtransferase [Paenarthrobacter aurescens]
MSYAGDLTPHDAWAKLEQGAILVDVRTEGEWAHIGIPDTKATENDPLFIQWNLAGGIPNSRFIEDLRQQAPEDDSVELVFLCRSGQRSISAAIAATQAGYTSYNVLEGFEGEPDRYGERTVNGWKNRGLPTNLGTE